MADTYLDVVSGIPTQIEAIDASSGVGDAGRILALSSTGYLDPTVMPPGVGADTKVIVTSEALAAGDIVNVWNSTGAKARKADATSPAKFGVGFVIAAVLSAGNATVYFEGTITGLSGLTIGATYFLDDTAGAITDTPVTGSGKISQIIGTALSATELSFEPGERYVLA